MPGILRASIVLLASALLSVTPSSVAHTCDPGPIYVVTIEQSDLPDCMTVTPRARVAIGSFGSKPDPTRAATLDIDNRCTDAIEITAKECAACGEPRTIAANARGTFVVETRPQSDAIDYDKHTKQSLQWTMATKSGAIASDVTVHDDVEACRGKLERTVDTVTSGCG